MLKPLTKYQRFDMGIASLPHVCLTLEQTLVKTKDKRRDLTLFWQHLASLLRITIAPNSRARKEEKKRGAMEEFEGRRRGMLTTGEWCNPVSNSFIRREPQLYYE